MQIHEYPINLLYLICISRYTEELYRRVGLPKQELHDSLEDLKIAMLECHMLHNIWGTHYGRWQLGFCNLDLIKFGRLEFGTMGL